MQADSRLGHEARAARGQARSALVVRVRQVARKAADDAGKGRPQRHSAARRQLGHRRAPLRAQRRLTRLQSEFAQSAAYVDIRHFVCQAMFAHRMSEALAGVVQVDDISVSVFMELLKSDLNLRSFAETRWSL